MYQHLQSPIIFPLLPFLPWAMVPRILIIRRSNQSSRGAASRAAGTEGADGVGGKGGPIFGLLILQPPFANSRKYFVMLQGVTGSGKQAVMRLAWGLCKHEGGCVARQAIASGSPPSRMLQEPFLPDTAVVHTGFFLNTEPI